MSPRRKSKRIKTRSEIKQEEDDEEWQSCSTPKRRNTKKPEQESSTTRDGNNGPENRETQTGEKEGESGLNKAKTNDKEVGPVLEKRNIKEESDEESDYNEEDELSESDSDTDYESDEGEYFSDDSRGELDEKRNANAKGDTGCEKLSWEFRATRDVKPESFRFRSARPPGFTVDTTAPWTPLSVFQLFCSSSVIRTIVKNTNKNAIRQVKAGVRKKWTKISDKDLYMYFVTVLFTSLVKLHKHIDYWKKDWPYRFPFPGDAMTRQSFEDIRTALSLCDPEEDEENESKKGTPEYDKLFKIKPFYTELVNACKANFQPHSNICVHERKPRKNKPLKCGYRLFALVDSLTGYTWNLHIDTGKSAATRGQTAGYRAVKNLLPVSVIGSGYTLYTDGLFSSPRLFTELLDKNIGCCGMISKSHSEFPKSAKNDFPAPRSSRGDIRWLRKGRILFVKWMDTREVAMCSTVHKAFTGQVIKRPVRRGKGWVLKQFSCPDTVNDFNRHMVASDSSEFRFCVPLARSEWHRILFYHLLDLAVVNSFLLHKEVQKIRGEIRDKPMTQKQFREELCKEMYKLSQGCDPDVARPPVRFPARAPSRSVLCLPVYYVLGNAKAGRKLCKMCNKTTPMYCQKCLIPLCLTSERNCFKEWHELEESDGE